MCGCAWNLSHSRIILPPSVLSLHAPKPPSFLTGSRVKPTWRLVPGFCFESLALQVCVCVYVCVCVCRLWKHVDEFR
jgi:hypothetical protein